VAEPGSGFPFAAVVGYDDAKLALLLGAIDPRLGGVLLRGDKGTAKTTLARGLAALLPDAPFVDLPLGASEDRVVGAVDVAAALDGGGWRLQPGLLARAHGGVLYVDEINLLADHLVDVLLDAAATGTGRVERDGISQGYPARFVLVGSMNPEEGDLRPQLLDRFGLVVDIGGHGDVDLRVDAVRRRLAFEAEPAAFAAEWDRATVRLHDQLVAAAGARADLPETVLRRASALCAELGIETLRADLTLCRAATACARLAGDRTVTEAHLERVAPLALAHRRRRGPFDPGTVSSDEVADALDRVRSGAADTPQDAPGEASPSPTPADPPAGNGRSGPPPAARADADGQDPRPADLETSPEPESAPPALHLDAGLLPPRSTPPPRRRPDPAHAASRAGTPVGPVIGARRPADPRRPDGIAPAATVLRGVARRATDPGGPMLAVADVREPVRRPATTRTLVVGLDTSASMGADTRIGAARDALLAVLLDAYQRRERVALVAIGGDEPRVVLQPTSSIEVARARLATLRPAGPTPLAAGLTAMAELAVRVRADGDEVLLVLITDGRATAAADGRPPLAAALDAADQVAGRHLPVVLVDAGPAGDDLGLTARLAARLDARHLRLDTLTAAAVEQALRTVAT
jgi:magnesium chelatase subunit D